MERSGEGAEILEAFGRLEDPRQSGKVLYPLSEILLVVLCGLLSGCADFVEMAMWGREHLSFLRRLQKFDRGIPSHDTLNDVIKALDPSLFEDCFIAWVNGLRQTAENGTILGRETIAIDGKTMRRSGDRRGGVAALHLISA